MAINLNPPDGYTYNGGGTETTSGELDLGSNCTISGMHFTNGSNQIAINGSHNTISGCTFGPNTWSAVLIYNGQYNTITGCTFNTNREQGANIQVLGGSYNQITNNHTYGGVTLCTFLYSRSANGGGPDAIIHDNVVSGNTFTGNGEEGVSFDCLGNNSGDTGAFEYDAIASVSGSNVTLSTHTWPNYDGFYMAFTDGPLQGQLRQISSHSGSTFTLASAPTGAVSGNHVVICAPYLHNTVSNNTIVNTGYCCVELYGLAFNNIIQNNICSGGPIIVRSVDSISSANGNVTATAGRAPNGYNLVAGNQISGYGVVLDYANINNVVAHPYTTPFQTKGNNVENNSPCTGVTGGNQWCYVANSGTVNLSSSTLSQTEMVIASGAALTGQATIGVRAAGSAHVTKAESGNAAVFVTASQKALALPVVTSVVPNSGYVTGGGSPYTVVRGSGFTGSYRAYFGSTVVTPGMGILSDTQINLYPPAHAAGPVHVTIVGPLGTSAATSADLYTYLPLANTGQASIGIAATGSAHVRKAEYGHAALGVAATGSEHVIRGLRGSASLSIAATGTAVRSRRIAGSAAVGVQSAGAVQVSKGVRGNAALVVASAGSEHVQKAETGSAAVAVSATGTALLHPAIPGLAGTARIGIAATGSVDVIHNIVLMPGYFDSKYFDPAYFLTAGAVSLVGTAAVDITSVGAVQNMLRGLYGSAALAVDATGAAALLLPERGSAAVGVAATGTACLLMPERGTASVGVNAAGSLTVAKPLSGSASIGVGAVGSAKRTCELSGSAQVEIDATNTTVRRIAIRSV
jgi:hypothetical protein